MSAFTEKELIQDKDDWVWPIHENGAVIRVLISWL